MQGKGSVVGMALAKHPKINKVQKQSVFWATLN